MPAPRLDTETPNEAAARWDARLRSSCYSPADEAGFAAWRAADPAHTAAYERLQADLAALLDACPTHPELRAMRLHVLGARPKRRLGLWTGLAAASVVGIAVFLTWSSHRPQDRGVQAQAKAAPMVYQTARGERRTIALADGSKITLDTSSRVEVAYTPARRSISLVEGQGFFEVAKNPGRPFVVAAGQRTVTAVGTAFGVRLDPTELTVTMLEGRVRVEDNVAATASQNLVAGQRLIARGEGAPGVSQINPHEAFGWSQGRVLFVDKPLSEVLAEVNRYSTVRFTLADPALAGIRINGLFRTEQPMGFIKALAMYLPIELHHANGEVVLAARPGAAG